MLVKAETSVNLMLLIKDASFHSPKTLESLEILKDNPSNQRSVSGSTLKKEKLLLLSLAIPLSKYMNWKAIRFIIIILCRL